MLNLQNLIVKRLSWVA